MFPKTLRIEVIALLCAKAAALLAIYYILVAPHATLPPDGEAMRSHILSEQAK